MRITKEGSLPENELFRGTCTNCKTEFECARKEGIYKSDQRDGDYLQVNCPKCNKIAFAYKVQGGQYVPTSQRDKYTWRNGDASLASQIAAVESQSFWYNR